MKPELTRTPMDRSNASSGFTLIELVITMLVTAVMSIAVATNYISQEEASSTVREVAQLQQQLRGAMYIMELDLRITGYDPEGSGSFGVINVQRWSITDENTDPALSVNGSPSLTVAYDWDPGVPANANTNGNGLLEEPTPAYRLFDDNNDGIFDLVRDDGTKPRPILAEGIDAVGYAYAFDADGDGDLDRSPGGFVIWAVDSDNDNFLDTNLDATDDGVIDRNDDTDGDYRITPADGAGLAAPVACSSIRMVQVWMLARARRPSKGFTNAGQFILVGDQVVPNNPAGFNDNIRRRLLVRSFHCRNTGL